VSHKYCCLVDLETDLQLPRTETSDENCKLNVTGS